MRKFQRIFVFAEFTNETKKILSKKAIKIRESLFTFQLSNAELPSI